MNVRSAGRVAAVIVALGVLALLGVVWLNSPRPKPASSRDPGLVSEAPPTPTDSRIVDPDEVGANIEELVKEGGRGEWTGRLSDNGARYRFTYERLEPREAGVLEVESPVLWLPGDEQSIVMRAGSGRIRRAAGEREPTEGRITGGIVARIYRGRIENDNAEALATPVAEVRLETLEFERDRLLVRTEDSLRITGEGIDATLHGLTASLSEDDPPLRLLRVARGGSVTIRPDALAAKEKAGRGSRGGGPADAPAPDAAPSESFFELTLAEAVRLEAGTVAMTGDSVRALARLVDGSLPDDAIASFEQVRRDGEPVGTSSGDTRSGDARGGVTDPESIALAWTGPLELRPLESRPPELARDEAHVTIASGSVGGVRVLESVEGIDARAMQIAYGATSRAAMLSGGGDPEGVRITAPDRAEFVGQSLELDLTTGVGRAAGPHLVRAIGRAAGADDPASPGDEPMWFASTGASDFLLDTGAGPIGSGAPILARSLIVTDGAEARRGDAYLKGGTMRAAFTEPERSATLAGVSVLDGARAQDGAGSWIEGEAIDILFAPDPENADRPTPFSARASGGIRAGSPEASLEAGELEASIVPDSRGESEIGDFVIRDRVVVTLPDGTRAAGDLITGDARTERAELSGAPATLAREDGSGHAALEAARFDLDGVARTLSVVGPGRAQAGSVDERLAQTLVYAEWERSLLYDDARGRAEIAGDVRARADEDVIAASGASGFRVHHASGDRVTLDLAPVEGEGAARRLVRALIEAGSASEADWARVESRVYALNENEDRRLLGVLFVTGPLMDARPGEQQVVVAGPGRLLVDNRARNDRADDRELIGLEPGADPGALASTLGTSLFEWTRRLDLDGSAGAAQMAGDVSFRHLDPASGKVTDLRADALEAGFDVGTEADRAALRDVTAAGSVVVRHGSLQIACDRARYDASTGEIVAVGEQGRRVAVLDESTGRQDEAGAIRLNLTSGAWSVEDPSAVSFPVR